MVKKIVVKTKFSQLNDKRSHFPDGVASLTFSHINLKEIDYLKKKKEPENREIFLGGKRSVIEHGEKST